MDKTRYARYTIRAWPVPDNGTDQATHVSLPSDVAVDMVNGGIVEPHQYLGTEPAICRAGHVYTKSKLLCARGVLSGDSTQRASCSFISVTQLLKQGCTSSLLTRTARWKAKIGHCKENCYLILLSYIDQMWCVISPLIFRFQHGGVCLTHDCSNLFGQIYQHWLKFLYLNWDYPGVLLGAGLLLH